MSDSHNDVKCLSSPKARNEPKSPDCKPDSPRKSDITLEGEVFKLPNPYYKIKQPPRKKLASEKKSPNYGKCDKKSTSKSLSPRSSSSSSSTKTCSSQFTYKKGKQECIKNPFASPTSPKIPLDELTLMYLKIVEGRDLGLSTPIPITEIEPEKVSLVDLGVDINDEQLKEISSQEFAENSLESLFSLLSDDEDNNEEENNEENNEDSNEANSDEQGQSINKENL